MHYRELDVWKQAVDLVVTIYDATEVLPPEEKYGLTAQMRRAASSVPNNIAEGEGRGSARDHVRFALHARGSLYELETQIIICERLGYLESAPLLKQTERVALLINGTLRHLRRTTG